MAVRLYRDAVQSGFIDWRIPGIPLNPEGMSQPASSPALPQAHAAPSRPPSQAFRPSQGSHASHSQHLQPSSSLPGSNGHSHPSSRAFEPAGPSNSPSAAGWNPPSASRARPNPSYEEEDLSLSQRLSQGQSFSQSASQHGRPSPAAQQQAVKDRKEGNILQVMQITDCSYAKAQRVSPFAVKYAIINFDLLILTPFGISGGWAPVISNAWDSQLAVWVRCF